MIFDVHMLAFEDEYRIREVDVPADKDPEFLSQEQLLDVIFHFGQNDFQPQECCSVSCGDVIDSGESFHIVLGVGFLEITTRQLLAYIREGRRNRSLYTFSRERFLEKFPKERYPALQPKE